MWVEFTNKVYTSFKGEAKSKKRKGPSEKIIKRTHKTL